MVTTSQGWANLGLSFNPGRALTGSLLPSQSANILVRIGTEANSFAPGYYTSSLTFLNMSNLTVLARRKIILIVDPTSSFTGSNP